MQRVDVPVAAELTYRDSARDWSAFLAIAFKFLSLAALVVSFYYAYEFRSAEMALGLTNSVGFSVVVTLAVGISIALGFFAVGHVFSMLNVIYDRQSPTAQDPPYPTIRETAPAPTPPAPQQEWTTGAQVALAPGVDAALRGSEDGEGSSDTEAIDETPSRGGLRDFLTKERHLRRKET